MTQAAEDILRALLDAALQAADPYGATLKALGAPAKGRNVVIGAGKAAARMAQAVEAQCAGAVEERYGSEVEGFVIVPKGYGASLNHIRVMEAAHPLPDARAQAAAREALALAGGLGEDDRLIALISGGGSALMAMPASGLTLADKQRITGALLQSGAAITEINTVRKHLSAIKGGWLARAAYPAPVETLVVSDIPGDDAMMVASGPTLRDATTGAEALAILQEYGIEPGQAVRAHLGNPASDTPDPGDPCFAGERVTIVARAADALAAAAEKALALGLKPVMLGDDLQGEARDLAADHARRALRQTGAAVILSGGETTVTVQGAGGSGGPNTEYALALALSLESGGALDGAAGIYALAADTDGIDGTSGAAGAFVTPETLLRAREKGLDPAGLLEAHDSARLFGALGDLVTTGPTLTNVNDFRAVLVGVL
ncbi:MAG: glycerate kinase [Proteobacteria bacterium]|nr:glycerate kinase [Pseudomonadota bacterium]